MLLKATLILALFGGLHCTNAPYKVEKKRVGCEADPCDHICVDTSSSYYCECYKNWDLQPDQHSCVAKAQQDYDAAYMGCFEDDQNVRDLHYLIWSRTLDCNVPQCLHDCRARGFQYAGLQAGTDCYCDNTYERKYNISTACTTPCAGTPTQMCGGNLVNSVYRVTRDARYVGCYTENIGAPDLGQVLWGKEEFKSVAQCNEDCARASPNNLFAGIFDGGECRCGNSYGRYGLAGEEACMVPCINGYKFQNCGGNTTNAVYRIMRGRDFSFFEEETKVAGKKMYELPVSEMFNYPHEMGMYGARIAVYASDTVNNVEEDVTCRDGCYDICGSIAPVPGFEYYQKEVVIREFYLKLSQLPGLVSKYVNATAIYVYAQTIYMDQTTVLPYAVFIRARQVIINYEANPQIDYNSEGAVLNYNITEAVIRGTPSDMTFQKLSLLCARMLLMTPDSDSNRVGWDMLDDLARDRPYTDEHKHFVDAVRQVRTELASFGRNDLYYAPYYSKAYYTSSLKVYDDALLEYKEAYNDLVDAQTECEDFKTRAGTLIDIFSSTALNTAEELLSLATDALAKSQLVYESIYEEYDDSREEMEPAEEAFKAGLEKWKKQQIGGFLKRLVSTCVKMYFGVFPCGAKDLRDPSTKEVVNGLELLEVTLENLAYTMEQIEEFVNITFEIIESEDYERYTDNVEAVAGLYVLLPEWENFVYMIDDIIFNENEEIITIGGAVEYKMALLDLCNWGDALTRSMIEFANNMRLYMMYDDLYQNRLLMNERYLEYLANVGVECERRAELVIAFAEQHYDVTIDVNDQLLTFCQAVFYEKLDVCSDQSRPDFAADIDGLIIAISSALSDAASFERPSQSLKETLLIEDSADAWANCTHPADCPVKVFRETGTLYVNIPTDHFLFDGKNLVMVEEVQLYFPGLVTTNGTQDVKFWLSSSGPFKNRDSVREEEFISRGLADMGFRYNIDTCRIDEHANLVGGSGNMIKQMTPFTTWVIEKDPRWTFIDASGVRQIYLTIMGKFESGINAKSKQVGSVKAVRDPEELCDPNPDNCVC